MRKNSNHPIFCLLLATICAMVLVSSTGAQEKLLAGRNVNMVPGTQLPFGDPYLQRQNEPSLAVSSRNPLHLLAGANDYRTVDFPGPSPGGDIVEQEEIQVKGDAWLGIFKSFDGGQSWVTTLLPGFPQDLSVQGTSSPLKGFQAGSDDVVRAGTNGMFYYSGIAFDRGERGRGVVFVARFIDNNNKEGVRFDNPAVNADPIKYIDTTVVASGTAHQFIDKPWLAVDIPRPGAATCTIPALEDTVPAFDENGKPILDGSGNQVGETITIPAQSFPGGNVYLAYANFVGNDNNIRTKLMFTRSTDCGASWSHPIKLSEGYPINQGTTVAVDPLNGHVYVAWRRFATTNQTNAIMIAKSTDMGQRFTKAVEVETFPLFQTSPFEQGTSVISFRTNAFPTMTVDNQSRVYVAWSQRGIGSPGPTSKWRGDARIMVKTSPGGLDWTAAAQPADDHSGRGHQTMPSLNFAAGKVFLLYYDLRLDHTVGEFTPNDDGQFAEERVPFGDLDNPGGDTGQDRVFTDFVVEAIPEPDGSITGPLDRRHTLTVRAAQASPAAVPNFTSSGEATRVSRYIHAFISSDVIQQREFNPPNLPLFDGGTRPFMGDYLDLAAAPTMLPDPNDPSKWIYNTGPETGALTTSSLTSAPAISPVIHSAWTDNRDVVPPADGIWAEYTPPDSVQSTEFPSPLACNVLESGRTLIRNQNIYTSRLTEGLVAGSFGNTKPINEIQRAFAVFVKNTTREEKFYRLTIDAPLGVTASFDQFDPSVQIAEVTVQPLSTVTRAVFVEGDVKLATVSVKIEEIDAPVPEGNVLADGLTSLVLLNPDILSPDILSPDILSPDILSPDILSAEVYNPDILSPDILSPDILSPDILSPDILSPDILSPDILSPDILSPDILSPDILSPDILSPDILSPDILSPDILSPDILSSNPNAQITNITWKIRSAGNTNAAYAFSPISASQLPEDITFLQLLVFRVTTTPYSEDCVLKRFPHLELISNIQNPDILSPDILSPDILSANTATFSLAPGSDEEILITLRILDTDRFTGDPFDPGTVGGVVASQAVNTEDLDDPSPTPPVAISPLITTTSLFDGVLGQPYSQTVQAIGGTDPLTWAVVDGALPGGLVLDPTTGTISETPIALGEFTFTVQITDSASPTPQTDTQALTIRIADPLVITTTTLPAGTSGVAYNETLNSSGGLGPVSWSIASGALPTGLTLDSSTGAISDTPTADGTFNFTAQATDSATPAQVASQPLSITVAAVGPLTPGITFLVQPTDTIAEQEISPAVTVQVADVIGMPIEGVTLKIGIGNNACTELVALPPGPIVVPPGLFEAVTDASGIASFAGKTPVLTRGGLGYTLVVTGLFFPDPLPATSDPFNVEGFCGTDSMGAQRVAHTATLLPDGQVLIAGGTTNNEACPGCLASAELYNPVTDTFSSTAGGMNSPRGFHTATLLPNGDVLLAGGLDSTGGGLATATAELYDLASGTFSPTGTMGVERGFHTATLLPNGKVLITGGGSVGGGTASAEIYDPATGTFSPTDSMSTVRGRHTASLLPNGLVLVVGGFDSGNNPQASAELYDPVAGTFSATGNLNTARIAHSATLLPNGKVLVAGGLDMNPVNSAELYDPAFGTFSPTGNMTAARRNHGASLLPNGKVLLVGGAGGGARLASAETYDPVAGTFAPTGGMNTERTAPSQTLLPDGRILVTGGIASATFPEPALASAEVFLPLGPMPLVDQQQPIIEDPTSGSLGIGGGANQLLAQVVTPGLSGVLSGVQMPVFCFSGDLVVEIQGLSGGLPDGTVLSSNTFSGASLPPFAAGTQSFRTLTFSQGLAITAGKPFAIVTQSTGDCGWFKAPPGDLYPAGGAFFFLPANINWSALNDGGRVDMPFKTLMADPQ